MLQETTGINMTFEGQASRMLHVACVASVEYWLGRYITRHALHLSSPEHLTRAAGVPFLTHSTCLHVHLQHTPHASTYTSTQLEHPSNTVFTNALHLSRFHQVFQSLSTIPSFFSNFLRRMSPSQSLRMAKSYIRLTSRGRKKERRDRTQLVWEAFPRTFMSNALKPPKK